MSRHRCVCPCHWVLDERNRADGVDVRDPLFAVSACAHCQDAHCAALSDARDAMAQADGCDAEYPPTDNGEATYLPPKPWNGEEGG